jgi:ATP-dependent Lon protease
MEILQKTKPYRFEYSVECSYIYKRGKNKGKPCNQPNCKLHSKHEHPKEPTKIENVDIIEVPIKSPKKVKIDTKPIINVYEDFSDFEDEDVFLEYYTKFKEMKPHMSEENAAVIIKLIKTLETLDPNSTEYYKNKTLIDKAFKIPWGNIYSPFKEEIPTKHTNKKSKKIHVDIESKYIPFLNHLTNELEENIYGMESVKNELINYICKWITNPNSNRNILGLYGPAGLCKTKIVQVLSTILKYPLETIPLGGIKIPLF